MASQLDEAFNWLVLILGIIAGVLSDFPQLLVVHTQWIELAVVRLLVFPVIILVFLWLCGLLARNVAFQVVMKSFSWIFASIILMADFVLLILGIFPIYIPRGPGTTPLGMVIQGLILFSPLYFSIFCLLVVRPRMREAYKDSKFLYSLPRQALTYIAAVLLYFFAIGLIEGILFGVSPLD